MARESRWKPAAGCVLLLVLFAARLFSSATSHSLTADEPHYVGAGLYLWESGDYHHARVLRFHPPLAYHLASLPLLAFALPEGPRDRDLGLRLLDGPHGSAVRVATRLPFALLAVWGALLAFLWAREVAGDAAGLLALFLVTFSPTVLAHGSLAHTDITVSVFFLQGLYTGWRYLSRPSLPRLLLFGGSVGLALIAKLSGLLLLASVPLLLAGHALGWVAPTAASPERIGRRLARSAAAGVGVAAVALAVVWAGYGGSFASETVESGALAGRRVPSYLQSFLFDVQVNAAGRETYLLGEFEARGPWYALPLAFALKTPLGILGLLGLAFAALRGRRSPVGRFLAAPFGVYLGVACFALDIPLGVRYLLPLYAPLFVFVATQLTPLRRDLRGAAVAGCCLWIAAASLWIHPHYLVYFHEAAGGPTRGSAYLLDSNLDWGQDLPTLAAWLAERGHPPVHLAYFGPEPPERYGIRYRPLRDCRPVAGLVAISINVREHLYAGNVPAPPERVCYRWLDAHEPVARPGGSILVYELPAR